MKTRRKPNRGVLGKAEEIRIALMWPKGDVSVNRFGTSVYLRMGTITVRVSDHATKTILGNTIHASTWSDVAGTVCAAKAMMAARQAEKLEAGMGA